MNRHKKTNFRLQKVRADGTRGTPKLYKIHELRGDWKMARRGFLKTSAVGLGLFGAAAGHVFCGGKTGAPKSSPSAGTPLSPSSEDCGGGIRAHDGNVTDLEFGADGKFLATASSKPDLKIWDMPTARLRLTTVFHPDAGTAFDREGRLLAFNLRTAKGENSIRVLDLATFKPVLSLPPLTDEVKGLMFGPDGRVLAVRLFQGHPMNIDILSFWIVGSGKPGVIVPGQKPLSFYPGGQLLACRSWYEDNLQLLKLPAGGVVKKFPTEDMGVFGPSGRTLISLSKNNAPAADAPDAVKKINVTLWDVKTWKAVKKSALTCPSVVRLTVSRDEKFLALESNGDVLTLLRLPELEPVTAGAEAFSPARNPVFYPGGGLLAYVSRETDRAVRCVNLSSGEVLLSISRKPSPSATASADPKIAFSPDGRTLAVGFADGVVAFWDISGRRQANCLFDAAALQNGSAAIQYTLKDDSGREIFHAVPSGGSLPQGAVCVCDSVSVSEAPANYCRCDLICTCVPV